MKQQEHPYARLYRNMRMTCSARFNASRRLQRHQLFSLWTVALLSVGLIILALLGVFDIQVNFASNVMNMAQVVMAILVLVVSVLLSGAGRGEKAERMHACGLEINALTRELHPLLDKDVDMSKYVDFERRYEEILKRYENHEPIDYEMAKTLKEPAFYDVGTWDRLRVQSLYVVGFSQYALLLGAEVAFFYLALR